MARQSGIAGCSVLSHSRPRPSHVSRTPLKRGGTGHKSDQVADLAVGVSLEAPAHLTPIEAVRTGRTANVPHVERIVREYGVGLVPELDPDRSLRLWRLVHRGLCLRRAVMAYLFPSAVSELLSPEQRHAAQAGVPQS